MNEENYIVKLQQFEGPFDLLLFFIERDELDIHDIPISSITNDFLEYIRQLEKLNLNVASEFILVAATLMRIKSRMLIPRKELDEEGNEIDPRQNLIDRLIEYKRIKSVIDDFKSMEGIRQMKELRGNHTSELKVLTQKSLIDSELESLSLFKIMRAFQNVMSRLDERNQKAAHEVALQKYYVKEEKNSIAIILSTKGRCSFYDLFESCASKRHAVVRLLALLEELNSQLLKITLGEGINTFWVEWNNESSTQEEQE